MRVSREAPAGVVGPLTMAVMAGLMGLLLAASGAQAATYRCTGADGAVRYSDRPCDAAATPAPTMGGIGPVRDPSPVPRATPTVAPPKPPSYVNYLSPHCAQLEEASRTAYARGARGDTLRALREEFQTKCADDLRRASEKAGEASREQNQQYQERRRQEQAQVAEHKRASQQCEQMRAVIADRRAAGATADARQKELLQTLQENYNRSCLNQR